MLCTNNNYPSCSNDRDGTRVNIHISAIGGTGNRSQK